MNFWAIADLHLSFARPIPRDQYAMRWRDHTNTIERNWRKVVSPGDLVLIPGDVSMARNHRDLQPDLEWLERLPGTKVLAPGNHDRWWNSLEAIRPLLRRSMLAVHGDAVLTHNAVVCGTIGAPFAHEDHESRHRTTDLNAVAELECALNHAATLRPTAETPLFVLWHYPPFDAHRRPGPCAALCQQFSVTACVYGHLHRQSEWSAAVQGIVGGVRFHCVAADAIGFRPLRIETARFPDAPVLPH